jgi:hypothetical protein
MKHWRLQPAIHNVQKHYLEHAPPALASSNTPLRSGIDMSVKTNRYFLRKELAIASLSVGGSHIVLLQFLSALVLACFGPYNISLWLIGQKNLVAKHLEKGDMTPVACASKLAGI